ncbi:protein of unknown function [Methylorubrum extorquens]|uniref:Uncharacterized protein n=1 Tax=Methylorubrum extorquens TaxID=408 RepID=A0A2N9AGX1_METEX|nr:protein of unknown function [Methylorubrum extorquens]
MSDGIGLSDDRERVLLSSMTDGPMSAPRFQAAYAPDDAALAEALLREAPPCRRPRRRRSIGSHPT